MPTVLIDFKEFAAEQGSEAIHDPKSNWLIFENGARSDGNRTHLPPSEDEQELLQWQLRYAELNFENLKAAYLKAEESYNVQCYWGTLGSAGTPDENWLAELRAMRIDLAERKKKLVALKARYREEPSEKDQAWNFYTDRRAADRQRAKAAQAALDKMKSEIPI
jgi:hypothetical protein